MQSEVGEAAEAREREKLKQTHQLADTTFRNAVEFMEDMKTLTEAAKVYHKSLRDMESAADKFYQIMEAIGAKAANLPGSIRKLGSSILDVVASYNYSKESQEDWIQSLNTDFIVPMDKKVKDEKRNLKHQHDVYRATNIRRTRNLRSTHKKLKKATKKKSPSRKDVERMMQLNHVFEEDKDMLHTHRVEGLRKALLEERRLYCFCLDHFCSVVQNQINYNSKSHHVFSSHVNDWQAICSSPNELPSESSILLSDPRSTRAFPPASYTRNEGGMHQGNSMLADVLSPNRPQPRRISCRVKALYPLHDTEGAEQLELNPGDFIDAIGEEQDGWLFGQNGRTGKSGWFPVQYVSKIWPPPQSPQEQRQEQRSGSISSSRRETGSLSSLQRNTVMPSPSMPTRMGSSTTEREFLQHQQHQLLVQQGSGSRRSSMNSVAMSHRS